METTEMLSQEHKNIVLVIKKLEKEYSSLEKGKEINTQFFTKAIDFIKDYADKFHHSKEEEILFKEFNKVKNLHCNPVKQMLHEHSLGREFAKNMSLALKNKDKKSLIENTINYCHLLREHIYKEDNILYPMADKSIDSSSQEKILIKFNKIESKNKEQILGCLRFAKSK